MSHDLESAYDETGAVTQTAFFSAREVPWHKLGTVTDSALTAQDALKTAHLADWDLRHKPFTAWVEDEYVKRPDKSLIVRTNPFNAKPDILGITSPTYGIVSNEEGFAFLDAFGDMGGAQFETAGSLDSGRRVFMTMRMPKELMIGGVDPVEIYMLATTTHDGSGPFEGMVVPNRVVCRNTLDLAMSNAIRKIRIRHSSNAVKRMQEAARLLAAMERYTEQFAKSMEKLVSKKVSMDDVDELLKKLFPDPPKKSERAVSIVGNKRGEVKALLTASPAIPDEFRSTGWGFVNAVSEWVDWEAPVRGGKPDYRRAVRSTFEDTSSNFKTRAMSLLGV